MGTKTKLFTSAMSGAPVLSGTAGALVGVLDSCLVTGFGTQTASALVVASGVATATVPTTPSAQVGSVILVAGATPSGLNGEQRVTAVGANSVSFATALGDQSATGTITVKLAPAGWTKTFSGTNLAAYKGDTVLGTGCLLRVDDTSAQFAKVIGYESMTDIATGLGLFPSTAQFNGGLWWSKSNAASAAARPWIVVADDRGVFFFVKNADTSGEYQGYYFGDILSLKSNDPYACVLRANSASRVASVTAMVDSLEYADGTGSGEGLYIARAANTLGGSVKAFATPVLTYTQALTHYTGSGGWPYPGAVDNGLLLTPILIWSAIVGLRGYYPGLRSSPQITNGAFATGDKIAGSGDMVGKTVTVIKLGAPTAGAGQGVVFIDTLSDWR